jgi:hypothetical protein
MQDHCTTGGLLSMPAAVVGAAAAIIARSANDVRVLYHMLLS